MDYSYWCIGFFEKIFINIFLINSENSLKGFWQQFGLRQQFGILAMIWDFGNGLGFGIWDLGFGISAKC
jgi:DMSO/TMAO reductase YedYZ heme-binding membrane subunit